MTVRNLNYLTAPRTVAIIGASGRPASVGSTVMRNLLTGGFAGTIQLVNPKYREIDGRPCVASVAELADTPDMAVIATPPRTVPGLIGELGRKGTRAAIVLTAGLDDLRKEMLDASRPYCLRILGPNCIGLMVPTIGLNASFASRAPLSGDLAFVSQSGALITAVVDWAAGRGIGFSQVVSLGEMADVDLGDMLDYLATDRSTRAVLLYVEAVTHAPKFLSAARRAARLKPVIVVKSGRHAGGAHAALSHTGALAGSDAAYDAAFRRSGLLRVKTLDDLFAAAETLARVPRLGGERLAILTNGGGAGVLASDELQDFDGKLASLGAGTLAALDRVLPPTWSRGNPVDIIGDADTARYADALHVLLSDEESDAVLVLHCPTATVSATDAARTVVDAIAKARNGTRNNPVLTCWLGDAAVKEAREIFAQNKISTFETTSQAITGFMQLVGYARAQTELMQVPPSVATERTYDAATAAQEIEKILVSGRSVASASETQAILAAYGIPINRAVLARDAAEVRIMASDILRSSAACAVKIASPDISHKSDVGGVRLDLESPESAVRAADEMMQHIIKVRPAARIDGYTVEPMVSRPHSVDVIVGMNVDQTFGPMMLFGAGGVAVEVMRDSALALPPLDALLARQLIDETRVARLLAGYRDRPAAKLDDLIDVLVRVSDFVIAHPEIRELDINPLLVDENGVIAIDARMKLASEVANPRMPLAIRPYPSHLQQIVQIAGGGEMTVRPIRPNDEPSYARFLASISPDDIRLRLFSGRRSFPHTFIAHLTQIDYAREMAFVAIDNRTRELLGVSRLVLDPDLTHGEFGILVRSDMQGRGIGWHLMQALFKYAQNEGVKEVSGIVHVENKNMLDMARQLGCASRNVEGDAALREVVWRSGEIERKDIERKQTINTARAASTSRST
jgi:acetyltransferase